MLVFPHFPGHQSTILTQEPSPRCYLGTPGQSQSADGGGGVAACSFTQLYQPFLELEKRNSIMGEKHIIVACCCCCCFIIILTNGTCTVGFILLSTACTVEIKQPGHKSTQIRGIFFLYIFFILSVLRIVFTCNKQLDTLSVSRAMTQSDAVHFCHGTPLPLALSVEF